MKRANIVSLANDLLLSTAGLLAITISLFDFIGVLDRAPWLSGRVEEMTLLSVSLLLLSVVVERRTRLDRIQAALDDILATYTFAAQYLDNAGSVTAQLERVIRRANETIMAVGAKSRSASYLDTIREAVSERRVIHYRLIDRNYIYHNLHEHLLQMIREPNVQIGWTPREKFGSFVVTENECVMAFASPYKERLTGLWLPGQNNSRQYTQGYLEIFSKCLPIRTEAGIKLLCIQCSPTTAGNAAEVGRLLQEELRSSLDQSNQTTTS